MIDPLLASIATAQLKVDEGFRSHGYICPAGCLTIGYGRNIDPDIRSPGITESEGGLLLGNDVVTCEADLANIFPGWGAISLARRATLINLRFQLGAGGFRTFRRMIAAVQAGDWPTAARELAGSRLMVQVPKRTARRVGELEAG